MDNLESLGLNSVFVIRYKDSGKYHPKMWNNIGKLKNHIRMMVPRGSYEAKRNIPQKRQYLENLEIQEIILDPKLGRRIEFDIDKLLDGGDFEELPI